MDRRTIQSTRLAIKTLPLKLPSMIALFLWSIVPLGMTLWFSFQRYNLLNPGEKGFVGFENYRFLVTDPGLRVAILNTLLLVAWVLVITVGLGTVLALLFNQAFFGRGKSTLLRLIAGLEEVASGDILIDGEKVNDVPPAKRGLAMVFQSYALYPHMSVAEDGQLQGEVHFVGRLGGTTFLHVQIEGGQELTLEAHGDNSIHTHDHIGIKVNSDNCHLFNKAGEALVATYCASKVAVISITQSAGLALIPHKINVNGISPGVVDTPMWDKVDALFARYENRSIGEKKHLVGEAVPFGRMGRPKDHVGAAVFLASSDSDYIVAQTLNVDGGNWMS